jgi:hypothetical protein
LSRDGANKIRVDVNCTAETKRLLDRIVNMERELDRENDRPERSRREILEQVLRKGAKSWQTLDAKVK